MQGEEIKAVLQSTHEIPGLESRSHGKDGQLAAAIVQVRRDSRASDDLHDAFRGIHSHQHGTGWVRQLRVRGDGRVTTLRQRANPYSESETRYLAGTVNSALQVCLLRRGECRGSNRLRGLATSVHLRPLPRS